MIFKVGDKVKVINNSSLYSGILVGDICKITEVIGTSCWIVGKSHIDNITNSTLFFDFDQLKLLKPNLKCYINYKFLND